MLLYECSDDFPRSNLSFEGILNLPDMPPAVKQCAGPSMIAGWAIGGQVLVAKCCFVYLDRGEWLLSIWWNTYNCSLFLAASRSVVGGARENEEEIKGLFTRRSGYPRKRG